MVKGLDRHRVQQNIAYLVNHARSCLSHSRTSLTFSSTKFKFFVTAAHVNNLLLVS